MMYDMYSQYSMLCHVFEGCYRHRPEGPGAGKEGVASICISYATDNSRDFKYSNTH